MYSEQAAALERDLAAARKANATLERDRDRLADLLRDEKVAHQATRKRGDQAEAENGQLRIQHERFKLIAATVATHEAARNKAEKDAVSLGKLAADNEELALSIKGELQRVQAERDDYQARATRLEEEIGPFRSLLAAMKARGEAEGLIAAELGKLDS
jgi:chromosome segregation ATPase